MSEGLMSLDAPHALSRGSLLLRTLLAAAFLGITTWISSISDEPVGALEGLVTAIPLALCVLTGVTAMVMLAHAISSRRPSHAITAAAFASVATLLGAVPLFFPGAILPPNADGSAQTMFGSPQSSLILFYGWHVIFVVTIATAVVLGRIERPSGYSPATIWFTFCGALTPAAVLLGWAALAPETLPTLTAQGGLTETALTADRFLVALSASALVLAIAVSRARSIISRWLIAVLILSLGENIVNLHSQRYSLGWYFNGLFGFLADSAILAALVLSLARIERDAHRVASLDLLTGVMSRAAFMSVLSNELVLWSGRDLSLLWIDLDSFKEINDRLGHGGGDDVLRTTASRISQAAPGDVLARLGGDEFALLVRGANPRGTDEIATRILRALEQPMVVRGEHVVLTASIGIAPKSPGDTPEAILHRADMAHFSAKKSGRNRIARYDPVIAAEVESRARARRAVALAIEAREIELDLQPIVDLRDGRVHGAEVLARWVRSGGRVPAGEFIPHVESAGLISALGSLVLHRVAESMQELLERRPDVEFITVNLAAADLLDETVTGQLLGGPLRSHTRRVVLEITESQDLTESVRAHESIKLLTQAGYAIAIDDFGAGFSNVETLDSLRPAMLKLDRSLIQIAHTGTPGGKPFLRSAVGLGQSLGCTVLAEGVENSSQARMVRDMGVTYGQGWHYGRPVPLDEFLAAAPVERSRRGGKHTDGPSLSLGDVPEIRLP